MKWKACGDVFISFNMHNCLLNVERWYPSAERLHLKVKMPSDLLSFLFFVFSPIVYVSSLVERFGVVHAVCKQKKDCTNLSKTRFCVHFSLLSFSLTTFCHAHILPVLTLCWMWLLTLPSSSSSSSSYSFDRTYVFMHKISSLRPSASRTR